jgi:hypothetical protein
MATVTYIGDETRDVSILPDGFLRRIEPDQKFTVPDEWAMSYACQPDLYEVDGFPWPPPEVDELIEPLADVVDSAPDPEPEKTDETPAEPVKTRRK